MQGLNFCDDPVPHRLEQRRVDASWISTYPPILYGGLSEARCCANQIPNCTVHKSLCDAFPLDTIASKFTMVGFLATNECARADTAFGFSKHDTE